MRHICYTLSTLLTTLLIHSGLHFSYTLSTLFLHSVYTFSLRFSYTFVHTFGTLQATLPYTFPTLCLHFSHTLLIKNAPHLLHFPTPCLHFCLHSWYTPGYTFLHLPYTLPTLCLHFANKKCATFATLSYTLSTHLSTLFVHSRPHFPALSLHFVYTLIQDIHVASWIDIQDNIA